MEKKRRREQTASPEDCLRLEPEHRLVPLFDPAGIAEFTVADRDRMGLRVLDDCCQEHIM